MPNFSYCQLIWIFSNSTCLKKIENLQKRASRFLCNNYQLSYGELLYKAKNSTIVLRDFVFYVWKFTKQLII